MNGRPWTDADIAELDRLRKVGTPAKVLAAHFGRTIEAVRVAAHRHGLENVPPDVALANHRAMNKRGVRKPRVKGTRHSKEHCRRISEALRNSEAHKAAAATRREKAKLIAQSPDFIEKCRAAGRKSWAARERPVPPPFQADYRKLKDAGRSRDEALAELKPRVDAWLRSFEGQLWRVRTGQARLVPNIKVSRAVSADHSLTGSSLASL